jgi:GNAT superfamily N-acetyltransferase
MVSVKENDMLARQDISPWLSALYVTPEYRERGVGTALIRSVFELCSCRFYSRVFLFIDSRYMVELDRFYSSKGWIFLDEDTDSDGNMTRILFHEL